MNLLVDTIPRLNKSKRDVILFFKGAGVPNIITQPLEQAVIRDKNSISKYQIAREILEKINQQNDTYLRERREILKRVCEFDTFDGCYDNDRAIAKANVAEISKLVKMKDTVTKYQTHLETERQEKIAAKKQEIEKRQKLVERFENIKSRFNALFSMSDPQERGKALEPVLNDLFSFYRISLSEAFTVTVENNVIEQIDGAILLDGRVYLVEMKWEKEPIGADKVGRFISRLFTRTDVGGIMISNSSFTTTAVTTANEALSQRKIVLIDLKDIYDIVDSKKSLQQFLRQLLSMAQINKKSDFKVMINTLEDIDYSKLS